MVVHRTIVEPILLVIAVVSVRLGYSRTGDSHPRLSRLFLFHGNQFTVKLNVVFADGLAASELLMV